MPVQLRGQHRGRSFCDRPAPERGNACLFVSKAITETAILQVDVQDALVFTGAFTIQCWVRPTTDTTQFHTIFSLGNRVCFTEHTLKVDPFDLHSDSIMWRTDYLVVGSNQEFSLSSYFPADAWRLCTLCRDTSSTVRVFVGTTNIRTWNNVGNSLGALHNVGGSVRGPVLPHRTALWDGSMTSASSGAFHCHLSSISQPWHRKRTCPMCNAWRPMHSDPTPTWPGE